MMVYISLNISQSFYTMDFKYLIVSKTNYDIICLLNKF